MSSLLVRTTICLALAAMAAQASATGTTNPAAPSVVATQNAAALAEVRLGRLGPPVVVARALAIAHTSMYGAWAACHPSALGAAVVALPRRPVVEHTAANKARAVSHAAYGCLVNLFPAGAVRLQAVMASQGFDATDTSTSLGTSQGIGNAAAAAGVRYSGHGRSVFAWGGPGQPNHWIDAGKWSPYNPGSNLTPAFPGWVSGHATFSAASAAVLRAFTGSDSFNFSTRDPGRFWPG